MLKLINNINIKLGIYIYNILYQIHIFGKVFIFISHIKISTDNNMYVFQI